MFKLSGDGPERTFDLIRKKNGNETKLLMQRMPKYSHKWFLALVVFAAGAVALSISLKNFIGDAKSGIDPYKTYRAYHLHLLGEIELGDCQIRLREPWFPKLSSYQVLSIDDKEVAFINVDSPLVSGKAVSISFIRNLPDIRPDALLAPVKVGEISAQFPHSDLTPSNERSFAWLPDSHFYAVSRNDMALRDGLTSAVIHCPKQ